MLKFTSLNLLHLWLIKNDRWCHLHHFQTDSFWNPAYFSPITAFSVFPLLRYSVKLKWSDGWRQQTSDRWSVTSAEGWNRQLACVFYREIKKTWDGFAQLQCPAGSLTSKSVTVYWKWKLASETTIRRSMMLKKVTTAPNAEVYGFFYHRWSKSMKCHKIAPVKNVTKAEMGLLRYASLTVMQIMPTFTDEDFD